MSALGNPVLSRRRLLKPMAPDDQDRAGENSARELDYLRKLNQRFNVTMNLVWTAVALVATFLILALLVR